MMTSGPPIGSEQSATQPPADVVRNVNQASDADVIEDGIRLIDLIGVARRRWEIILAVTILGTGIATIKAFSQKPQYTSEVQILIEPEHRVVDIGTVMAGVSSDAAAIETEINLLRSRDFLADVAARLFPNFIDSALPEDVAESKVSGLERWLPKSIAVASGLSEEPALITHDEARIKAVDAKVAELSNGLSVAQKGRSFIIAASYTSPRASEAARIANAVANFYIESQTTRRKAITGEASDFLENRLSELEEELRQAEARAHLYRSKHDIKELNGPDFNSQQMVDLTNMLVTARANRKEKEARQKYIHSVQAKGGSLVSLSEVLQSPYIVQLWQQGSDLRRKEAELRNDFGANHPTIKNIITEQSEIASRIKVETSRIVDNLQNQLEVERERERSIREDIDHLVAQTDESGQAAIELRKLDREAEASREIYENFLLRFKQTREQEALIQPNTRVIASAKVPSVPSGRSSSTFIFLGFVFSSALGCAAGYLRDRLDRTLRLAKDTETLLGVPCLGLIPFAKPKEREDLKFHQYMAKKPLSGYAEMVRSVYTNIKLNGTDTARQVIQVTSALPSEGKTSFAVSLAAAIALDGRKVLLIDLDLRRPSVGREIDFGQATCLLDFLSGKNRIGEVVIHDRDAGFHVLGVRSPAENPGRMIESKAMVGLFRGLRKHYEFIIIDSAPILGLSDSKIVSRYADAVVFVVKWGETPVANAVEAVQGLRACRANVVGSVMTQVDLVKQRRYGYEGGYVYDRKYGGYYRD